MPYAQIVAAVLVMVGPLYGPQASPSAHVSRWDKVPSGAVEVEEVVTRYAPANNGAGPLWCYGSALVVRQNDDVYGSAIETGENVPPLLNTRWQLWRRSRDGWTLAQHEDEYCEREPCPLAAFHRGPLFLSVNPSVEAAGATHGRCEPRILEFDPNRPGGPPREHKPDWAEGSRFTEHSYRGFAADGARGELLLLNINAETGAQFVSHRDAAGRWHARGKITFPIRACYPQVALRRGAGHVMAIGDIVEPVDEWKKLKFERLKNSWDYVFRRLFYTWTPDIGQVAFGPPLEIDTVEETCGHILNLDLYVDDAGAAHLLYLKRPFQYDFIRDKYFPGRPMAVSLEYVVINDGQVRSRATLAKLAQGGEGLEPSYARFHVRPGGALYVVLAGTVSAGNSRTFGNFLGRIQSDGSLLPLGRLDLQHPFRTFFTNTTRAGSEPSDVLDLFGSAGDPLALRYARLRIETSEK